VCLIKIKTLAKQLFDKELVWMDRSQMLFIKKIEEWDGDVSQCYVSVCLTYIRLWI
jgi:hypothetical protein